MKVEGIRDGLPEWSTANAVEVAPLLGWEESSRTLWPSPECDRRRGANLPLQRWRRF